MGDFVDYESIIDLEIPDLSNQSAVCKYASLVANYIESGIGEPIASDVTDNSGKVSFSELPTGVYLLVGSKGMIGDVIYDPFPTLVSVLKDPNGSELESGDISFIIKHKDLID